MPPLASNYFYFLFNFTKIPIQSKNRQTQKKLDYQKYEIGLEHTEN